MTQTCCSYFIKISIWLISLCLRSSRLLIVFYHLFTKIKTKKKKGKLNKNIPIMSKVRTNIYSQKPKMGDSFSHPCSAHPKKRILKYLLFAKIKIIVYLYIHAELPYITSLHTSCAFVRNVKSCYVWKAISSVKQWIQMDLINTFGSKKTSEKRPNP